MTKQLDQLERLAEIKEEILVLLSEALDLVRGTPEEQVSVRELSWRQARTASYVQGCFYGPPVSPHTPRAVISRCSTQPESVNPG